MHQGTHGNPYNMYMNPARPQLVITFILVINLLIIYYSEFWILGFGGRREKVSHVTVSGVWEGREKVSHVTVSGVWGKKREGVTCNFGEKGKGGTCNGFWGGGKEEGKGVTCNGFWGVGRSMEKVSHVTVSGDCRDKGRGVTCNGFWGTAIFQWPHRTCLLYRHHNYE